MKTENVPIFPLITLFLAGMALSALITNFTTRESANESWKMAVQLHGCGEYYLDKNNDVQWRWKP